MGLPFKLKILGTITGEKEKLEKMWKLLDGKKTLIGAVLVSVPVIWAGVEPILTAGGVSPEKLAAVGGLILGGIGIAHKVLKAFGVAVPDKNQ
jgi:hypothetical protein